MSVCRACGDQHEPGPMCPRTGQSVTVGPCGTRLDRYDVERFVGGGGMGAVYQARHAILGTPVALKLLGPRMAENTDFARRFLREAQVAASIGNPHIVRVSDFGTADGRPFLVMELLEGSDLASVIDRRGPLRADEAVDVTLQILDGLGAAHDAGIVHRDMKPANVFLTSAPDAPGGPKEFVKILDFGISKVTGPDAAATLTRTGVVMGTPYYMAPEQARGVREADHRVDIYATAVILYQMLSRALPFRGSSYEDLVIQICTGDPIPLVQLAPSLPEPFVAAVQRGMSREPSDRFPTAAAFSEALWSAAGGTSRSRRWESTGKASAAHPAPVVAAPPATPARAATQVPATTASAAQLPSATTGSTAPLDAHRSPRGWLMPLALAFLGVTILVAVVAALWIWGREPAPMPAASLAVAPPAAAPPAQAPVVLTPVAPTGPPVAPPGVEDDWADLAEMMADVPGLANAGAGMIPVPPAPAPVAGVGLGEPYIIGSIPAVAVRAAMQRAARSMNDCRLPGRATRVRVGAIVDEDGSVTLNPYPGGQGDPAAAACVANRFRDAGGLGPQPDSAIVYFEVSLAPR